MKQLTAMGIEVWQSRLSDGCTHSPNDSVLYGLYDNNNSPLITIIMNKKIKMKQKKAALLENISNSLSLRAQILDGFESLQASTKCILFNVDSSFDNDNATNCVHLDFEFDEMLSKPEYKLQLWTHLQNIFS